MKEVIARLRKDIETLRGTTDSVSYHAKDKDQLADDIEALLHSLGADGYNLEQTQMSAESTGPAEQEGVEVITNFISRERSGRTARMIEVAKRLNEERAAVYIICLTRQHANEIVKKIGPGHKGIKVETLTTMRTFDMQSMTLKGAHPNCVVLVDHHAIESSYSMMLEMFHRFDKHITK